MPQPKKPSGYCNLGHDQRKHAFIDSCGDWRCRLCRKEKDKERDYWKQVSAYINGNLESLLVLEKYHWRTP